MKKIALTAEASLFWEKQTKKRFRLGIYKEKKKKREKRDVLQKKIFTSDLIGMHICKDTDKH